MSFHPFTQAVYVFSWYWVVTSKDHKDNNFLHCNVSKTRDLMLLHRASHTMQGGKLSHLINTWDDHLKSEHRGYCETLATENSSFPQTELLLCRAVPSFEGFRTKRQKAKTAWTVFQKSFLQSMEWNRGETLMLTATKEILQKAAIILTSPAGLHLPCQTFYPFGSQTFKLPVYTVWFILYVIFKQVVMEMDW